MKTTLIVAALVSGASCFGQLPDLPHNTVVQADLLQLAITPEIQGIAERFAASVRKNNVWMMKYINEHPLPPGELLPYHENFGITKDEYTKFFGWSEYPKLERIGQMPIRFVDDGDQTSIYVVWGTPEVGVISIDKKRGTLKCNMGVSEQMKEFDVKTERFSAVGRWKGVSFQYPKNEKGQNPYGSISIGRDAMGRSTLEFDIHIPTSSGTDRIGSILRWSDVSMPSQSTLQTPTSGTPAADAPVAPPPGAAGR